MKHKEVAVKHSPVAPVCTYNYIGEVLHIYVEAAGATPLNTTVSLTNVAPYELTVNAVVQRPNRGDRHYRAFSTCPADTLQGVFPMASSMSGFLSNYS